MNQAIVTELPEYEELVPSVNVRLSPVPGGKGYPEEPYKLYRDGALIQQGLTDKRGFIKVEHIPGTAKYEVEWVNGHRFALNVQEKTSEGIQGELEKIQRQGFRKEPESGDAPVSPQGNAEQHQITWAQVDKGQDANGALEDENDV